MQIPACRLIAGLSPRGRGKLDKLQAEKLYIGSIPAWAGETTGRHFIVVNIKVYPRVGGFPPPTRG